jgi:hypothetical protein
MVILKTTLLRRPRKTKCRAMLTAELVVAMAILVIAVLPIGYSLIVDTRFLKANYQHAVAMEIVDGEMEILAAGEWQSFPEGTHPYPVHVAAATNLPPGQFELTRTGNHLRLEWNPDQRRGIGGVVREVTVK